MDGPDLPPSFSLHQLTNFYDITIRAQQDKPGLDTVLCSKLDLVCRILLSTCQLSEEQASVVQATKEKCESMLQTAEQELKQGKVSTEYDDYTGKWTWQFEIEQEYNLLCLDEDQLEDEEQALVLMANAPIPSARA